MRSLQPASQEEAARDRFHLLRFTHIFATSVREVLEEKLLERVSPFPLTLSQFHLLKLLALNGRHQAGEVADFLGVSPPAATKNIDKLERLGLVTRGRSLGDRRATLLTVSPRGLRLVRGYERAKRERLRQVFAQFQPGEIRQLAQLLERFAVSLLSLEPTGNGPCLRCTAYVDTQCPVADLRGGCPYQEGRRSPGGTPRNGEGT